MRVASDQTAHAILWLVVIQHVTHPPALVAGVRRKDEVQVPRTQDWQRRTTRNTRTMHPVERALPGQEVFLVHSHEGVIGTSVNEKRMLGKTPMRRF